ncbi:hypothetical protein C0075_04500 [Rhizobium sp. KAs_5_22]|uniref:hypothetical protein n=1 Tax=Ciceribacter selenitireducens TaxID=448181 RepID=UPI00048F5584|nr:hypothetical protein [Ciceribacter selenitireducens]PPJ45040.1 hypothetical protein C0075_04500 [Rhizobium sp. KAs_5_22]
MIDENATIGELVKSGSLLNREKYVRSVLSNCYLQYQKRKWPMNKILVRIGRVGDGKAPNYRIELVTDGIATPEQFAEHMSDQVHHAAVDNAVEFNGLGHKSRAYGFDKETWSKSTQTIASLEDLRDQLMKRSGIR